MTTLTPDDERWIATLVRSGYMTASEIVRAVAGDGAGRLDARRVSSFVRAAIEVRRRELAARRGTGYARLRTALDDLARSGVLTRENYWCCQKCAYAAIDEEIDAAVAEGATVRGYVFFHAQDTERVVSTGHLLLRYGGVTAIPDRQGRLATMRIGDEIVSSLQRAGLAPSWSGAPDEVIRVPLVWDKPPPESVRDDARGARTSVDTPPYVT